MFFFCQINSAKKIGERLAIGRNVVIWNSVGLDRIQWDSVGFGGYVLVCTGLPWYVPELLILSSGFDFGYP